MKIEAEYILANYFELTDKPLTTGMLQELKEMILSRFVTSFVNVDISSNVLNYIIQLYPNLFEWDNDGRIRKAKYFKELFESVNVSEFDHYIPDFNIRTKILSIIKEFVVNGGKKNKGMELKQTFINQVSQEQRLELSQRQQVELLINHILDDQEYHRNNMERGIMLQEMRRNVISPPYSIDEDGNSWVED